MLPAVMVGLTISHKMATSAAFEACSAPRSYPIAISRHHACGYKFHTSSLCCTFDENERQRHSNAELAHFPKRLWRCWKARSALKKPIRRKAGQTPSLK